MTSPGRALDRFFFTPASPRPLAALRIGLAATLLLQALALARPFLDFYLPDGVLQGANGPPEASLGTTGWLHLTGPLGISPAVALVLLGVAYLVSLVAMLIGWRTRAAVAATWIGHLLLTNGQPTVYGLDAFAHSSLFLLIFSPAGAIWSWDARGRPPAGQSVRIRTLSEPPMQVTIKTSGPPVALGSARFMLRVFQLYLCIAYLACGLEKAVGPQWWTGEAIWRALNLPTYSQLNTLWLARFPLMPRLAGWFTLLVETGYPLFIWPRLTRPIWVFATLMLHAGIGVFLGLPLFGMIMMVLTFSIWAVPAETERSAPVVAFSLHQSARGAASTMAAARG